MTNPTPATVAALNTVEAAPAPTARVLNKTQLRAVKAFAAAKRAEDKAKKSKARWEKVLRETLGDATTGVTPEGIAAVKIQAGTNSSFDRDVLRTRFPEAYTATLKVSEYTFLKVL